MAKKTQAAAPARTPARQTTTNKAPAVTKPSTAVAAAVGGDLMSMMQEDSGKGVSTASEDNIVPLIYTLQSQSPQVLTQKQECIKPGLDGNKTAIAGNIWFRGTKTLIDGEEEGLVVQPVHFGKKWMEWMPNRGGLAGIHPTRPEEAVLKTDPKNPKKQFWELPNGNVVNETRDHVVIVHDLPGGLGAYVLPMSGSNHTASRAWMGMMNRKRIPGTDKKAPSYAFLYRVKTVPRSNDQGDWFAYEVEDAGEDGAEMMVQDLEAYKLARQLHDDFETGKKQADVAADMASDDLGSTGDEDEAEKAGI